MRVPATAESQNKTIFRLLTLVDGSLFVAKENKKKVIAAYLKDTRYYRIILLRINRFRPFHLYLSFILSLNI